MAADASQSQSRSEYTEYLRTCSTVCQCVLAVTGLKADSELSLNAKSNQVTKIVQNCNKTVKLQISHPDEEQM